MGELSSIFAAATSFGGLAVIGVGYWLAGPRQLKPTNTSAKVITARKFPNIFHVQKFAVKDDSALYLKFGASEPTDVPLKVYSVTVDKTKDHALVLNDKMKIDVSVMFQVSIDDGSESLKPVKDGEAPKAPVKATDAIIKAVGALEGIFTDDKVQEVLESRFDSALRLAAANMGIEEINTHRESFIQQVKEGLKLDDVGFKLNEVSLRTLTPALLSAYNPSNSYDAEGMKKVVEIVQASERDRNLTEQEAQTRIAQTNKEQELRRYTIQQEQEAARLAKDEAIANATAEQARRVAENKAENDKKARLAQIQAEQETASRDIAKTQQVELATVEKQKAVSLATQETTRLTREAEIATQTAVETAERDKEIRLSLKNAESAQAQATANEARAKAVVAEQAVVTAAKVAEADRAKQVEIIEAETEAGRAAAGKRIDADTAVYVAEQQAKAVKTEAQGIAEAAVIDAKADAEAANVRAAANYETLLQPLRAAAEGKSLEADALTKLNTAINILSDEARAQQVDLERVRITPEVVDKMSAALRNVGNMTILSGMPGLGGANGSGSASSGNMFEDAVSASQRAIMTRSALKTVLSTFGGDVKVADNMPDLAGDLAKAVSEAPVAPVSLIVAPPTGNDNAEVTVRQPKSGGGTPAPQV